MVKYKFILAIFLLVGCTAEKDTLYKVSYYNTSGIFVKSQLIKLPSRSYVDSIQGQGNLVITDGRRYYETAPIGWNLELEQVK